MEFTYENLDQSLIGLSRNLKKYGVKRETRGFDCSEFPEPVMVHITNPTDRYHRIKERKWNSVLPFIETMWLMLGINSLNIPGSYVKNLYNFSDDGEFMRGGYGPRLRAYTGLEGDYTIGHPKSKHVYSGEVITVDQIRFIIETLKKDCYSRQATITIGDPVKDCFKQTKDFPCTRELTFSVNHGRLDLTVYMRSNDLFWGYSAVNVFNFTFIQEILANILGLSVGHYHHVANNLHHYSHHEDLLNKISKLNIDAYGNGIKFEYSSLHQMETLSEFEEQLFALYNFEQKVRAGEQPLHEFKNPLFIDWSEVIWAHWNPEFRDTINFKNPHLNRLYHGRNIST